MSDASDAGEYTIHASRAESGRLKTQAAVMSGATTRFLTSIGVAPGWSCLDVGCGTGDVSIELGRLVAPTGSVLGVDISEETLASARAAARSAGAADLRFERADVYSLPFAGQFDLAYARLLLSHLDEPVAALRGMAAAVTPGRFVAVEDLFTDSLHSDPPTPALDDLKSVYDATVRSYGGDPTIGPRLRALCERAGLQDVREASVVNVMTTTEQKHFLATLVESMRTAMLESGSATADQIDTLRNGIDQAARDPAVTFYQARIHQVVGRTPTS